MSINAGRILSILFFTAGLSGADYWQQYVHYNMDVYLDTSAHTISGKSIIKYVNHAPHELSRIYMHLYPNAFNQGTVKYREYLQGYGRSRRAREFTKNDNDKYFSSIEIHDYKITQGSDILADHFEIDGTLLLSEMSPALKSGDSVIIELNWTHFIGEQFERAGRVGQQYNFAQWYPKIVVYDENGWSNTAFHAEGEFYGEFGDFEVSMNVPGGYIIAASGVVKTGDPGWESVRVDTAQNFLTWEKTFKVSQNNKRDNRRVVTFSAENVHDFAWVTSPDFLYEQGRWQGIDVHVLFNRKNGEKWTKKVVNRSEAALEWLSTNFGQYPYPQVSTVDRLKSGGMEYPMLVMNGSESESLIIHEIGHIWFYGILGNNEVREAWLDEGFTTFQTRRYMMNKYGPRGFDLINSTNLRPYQKKFWKFSSSLGKTQWSTINFITGGKDEPVGRWAYMFNNSTAYRQNAYTKPSLMLEELNYIMGDPVFTEMMFEYYGRWNLKHTSENRFINAVEKTGGEDMDWFFRPWLHNTKLLDYEIKNWSKNQNADGTWEIRLKIKRTGTREMPQLVEVKLENGSIYRTWWRNHKWRAEDDFIFTVPAEPAGAVLDPDVKTIDIDRRNNYTGRMGSLYMLYRPGMNFNPRDKYVIQWLPTIQYHEIDQIMPGIKLSRKYGPWQFEEAGVQVGSKTGRVFWSLNGRFINPLGNNNLRINYKLYDLGAVREIGAGITKIIDFTRGRLDFLNFTLSFRLTDAEDTTRTDLFDQGRMVVFMSAVNFNSGSLKSSFILELAPGGWSDWSFSRLTFIENFEKNFKKIGVRGRGIIGRIWSGDGIVPVQEKYTVEGAGSGDLYAKFYLRDESSLFNQRDLRGRYHLPGDANLRGFSGMGFLGVETVTAFSLEGFFFHSIKGFQIELASFTDFGWLKGKKYADIEGKFNYTFLADSGLGLRVGKKVLGQKLFFRIDFPFVTRIGHKTLIDEKKWIISFQKGL